MQMREQRRAPRADRQQPSGASNRKTAAVSSAEASSRNWERNRANYHQKIRDARAKYAWEVGQRVRRPGVGCAVHDRGDHLLQPPGTVLLKTPDVDRPGQSENDHPVQLLAVSVQR